MKRFFVLLFLSAAAAFGIWYAMRTGGLRTSSANVAALLPKETTALIHVPDVNGTRAKWHETDLYKLWREPALQDFLQKTAFAKRRRARRCGKGSSRWKRCR